MVSTSHVHNDLSKKDLCLYTFIEQNHFEGIMYVCFSRNTKHAEFQMISFDNDKAI